MWEISSEVVVVRIRNTTTYLRIRDTKIHTVPPCIIHSLQETVDEKSKSLTPP
jgi:hypothetical protein